MQLDQHGAAAAASSQRPHVETRKGSGKPPKTPKAAGKDPPRDMLYYTKKLTETAEQSLEGSLDTTPAIFHDTQEGEQCTQGPSGSSAQ